MNPKVFFIFSLSVALAACDCRGRSVQEVPPAIQLPGAPLDFGFVRRGSSAQLSLLLRSTTSTPVRLLSLEVQDGDLPGSAAAFQLASSPDSIPGQGQTELRIGFFPTELRDYNARLVVHSDDPDEKTKAVEVRLLGQGADPQLVIVPTCTGCVGIGVTEKPPAIDFGLRPAPPPPPRNRPDPVWPLVALLNGKDLPYKGDVPLSISSIQIQGPDKAYFSVVEGSSLAFPLLVDPRSGQTFHLRFDPVARPLLAYAAELVVQSDDPDQPLARMPLKGTLKPNTPPWVKVGIVEAAYLDGTVVKPTQLGDAIPVQPNAVLVIGARPGSDQLLQPSAWDPAVPTTDAEDGPSPTVLTYGWSVAEAPAGSTASLTGNPVFPKLTPDKVGHYRVHLDVTDLDGAMSGADLSFEAIPKRDLVVRLDWSSASDPTFGKNVDLDLHLVRPGAQPFDWVAGSGGTGPNSGDVNGYTKLLVAAWNWGDPATAVDDAHLDIDDIGNGPLIENISMNFPENDPACASAACRYEVYVHYFRDARSYSSGATACGCAREGDPCALSCAAGSRCVSGMCTVAPLPTVRVFLKPTPQNPGPALTVPLPTDPSVPMPGPCFLWHVATVTWPANNCVVGTPPGNTCTPSAVAVTAPTGGPEYAFYGTLPAGGFTCLSNCSTSSGQGNYCAGILP